MSIYDQLKPLDRKERVKLLRDSLKKHLCQTLDIEDDSLLTLDTGFGDLGLDSVSGVQFAGQIVTDLDRKIDLPSTTIFDYPSINKLAIHIETLIDAKEKTL